MTREILQFATPFVFRYVLHRRGNRAVHHACFLSTDTRSTTGSADNDPFAGSPTKTLLRLLLPLRAKVQRGSTYEPVLPRSTLPPPLHRRMPRMERRAVCTTLNPASTDALFAREPRSRTLDRFFVEETRFPSGTDYILRISLRGSPPTSSL